MITYTQKELNEPTRLLPIAMAMVNASPWKRKKGYTVARMLTGLLGEVAYGRHTNQPVNLEVYAGGDGGVDFPDGCNLKTRDVYPGKVPHMMIASQDLVNKKAETYVYAVHSPYKEEVVVVGKISADSFEDNMEAPPPEWGISNTYMINMETSLDSLDEVYDNVTHDELQTFCNYGT